MAWEDFLILADQISELAEIGKTKGERIMNIRFIGNGEPLTNKRLPDMIANLRARNICERFEVTTNASLLTNDMSDRLIESGLTRLLVSIQGTTAEKYKEVCGYNLDMQNFLSQLEYFYAHRKDCKVYIKTIDVALDGKDDEQKLKQAFSQQYMEQRSMEELRAHANKLAHKKYGNSLRTINFESRLQIAASMLRGGTGSRTESFAKALFLKKADVDRLL